MTPNRNRGTLCVAHLKNRSEFAVQQRNVSAFVRCAAAGNDASISGSFWPPAPGYRTQPPSALQRYVCSRYGYSYHRPHVHIPEEPCSEPLRGPASWATCGTGHSAVWGENTWGVTLARNALVIINHIYAIEGVSVRSQRPDLDVHQGCCPSLGAFFLCSAPRAELIHHDVAGAQHSAVYTHLQVQKI